MKAQLSFLSIVATLIASAAALAAPISIFNLKSDTFQPLLSSNYFDSGFSIYKDMSPMDDAAFLTMLNLHVFEALKNTGEISRTETPGSNSRKKDYFRETHLLWMPQNARIRVAKGQTPQEDWAYPSNLILVHCIYAEEAPLRLEECRVEMKISRGKWRFATYVKDPDSEILRLTHFPQGFTREVEMNHPLRGRTRIAFEALTQTSCTDCHTKSENEESTVMPCGFRPGKGIREGTWVSQFEKEHGHSPFKEK